MADLENLLLEAAGRTNTGGRNRRSLPTSRRRREGSYSDGGSDSREDNSDDEDGGYASRKPSGSQIPLKKRFESSDRDDGAAHAEGGYGGAGSDHEGGSSDESDFGDDLYKDEEDRQKLAGMSEFQREMILAERADKKGDKNFTEKFRSKRENEKTPHSKKETQLLSASRGVRTSARSADRAAAKDGALNELRAKRLKQQDTEAHRKLRDLKGSSTKDFTPIKRKPFSSAKQSSSSQSDSESGSQSDDDGGLIDSDDDRSDGLTFEDIREITIRRSKLANWFMEPFFEELIVGCFVRVGIGRSKSGPIYRLCMVRNVDATDPDRPYKLENKSTYKYLNVTWGNDSSAARWQMAMISDGRPSEEEYKQWMKEMERTGGRMPSKQEVSAKKEAIKEINNYVYSAETVKQMLQEKKSASIRPMNVAAEKDRLRRELEVAQSKRNEAEVNRIKAKIKQLDASRQKQSVDKKALRLAEMNRKNRVENFKNASELRPNAGLEAGEAGYDPFSRRWTRSRNVYVGKQEGDKTGEPENGEREIVNGEVGGLMGAAATAAALEAAADAGKLVDTMAPVDKGTGSNSLHDFDLPISLAVLQKFKGPQGSHKAFMARKQMIEATVGCKVPENDGKRHGITLTVSDYKRRRGLL